MRDKTVVMELTSDDVWNVGYVLWAMANENHIRRNWHVMQWVDQAIYDGRHLWAPLQVNNTIFRWRESMNPLDNPGEA